MTTITIPENANIQETTRVAYAPVASPGDTTYAVPFPFFATSELKVWASTQGYLTEVTHWTIATVDVDDGFQSGVITMNTAIINEDVLIWREIDFSRLSDWQTSGPFPMASLNTTMDKLYAMMQEVRTIADRSVRLDDTDTTETVILPDATERAGKYLYFDVNGTPAVSADATVSEGTTVSSWVANNFLNVNSQSDARTALAVGTKTQQDINTSSIASNLALIQDLAYRGGLAYTTAAQAITVSTATPVTWAAAEADTVNPSTVWAAGQPTQLVTPIGAELVRLRALIQFEPDGSGYRQAYFRKDGATDDFIGNDLQFFNPSAGWAADTINLVSGIIPVVGGTTYFETMVYQTSATAGTLDLWGSTDAPNGPSWFQMEVVKFTAGNTIALTNTLLGYPIVNDLTTTHNLVATDAWSVIVMDNAAANSIVIPASSNIDYPINTEIYFIQKGAGTTTVTISTDTLSIATGLTADLNGTYSVAGIKKIATTEWVLFGNLVAS